jgi:peptidoglycan/LPS O-acetylase OafA/YrhL
MIKVVVLMAAAVVLIAIVVAFIVYPLVEVWGQARGFRHPKRR